MTTSTYGIPDHPASSRAAPNVCCALWPCLCSILLTTSPSAARQPAGVSAFFRDGQTFLTWEEDTIQTGETYRIYRHTAPLASSVLTTPGLLAEIGEGSSYYREMHKPDGSLMDLPDSAEYHDAVIERFVIHPVDSGIGAVPGSATGLFVWTVKETDQCSSWYAVTTVSPAGSEDSTVGQGNTCGPILEKREEQGTVRYYVGKKRDFHTMWLDYELFGDSYMGYAFPFAITRSAFESSDTMPGLHLDGYGTTAFNSYHYSNYGAGDFYVNALPTWYFGYHKSRDWDGISADGQYMRDTIANYIQYRTMQSVLWARRHYGIKEPKLHITGVSMGASGAFGMLMAFPSFVTSIWAQQGLTRYRRVAKWEQSIHFNYGNPENGNPVQFLPLGNSQYPELDWVTRFDGEDIYDVRNVVEFLSRNTHVSFGLISAGHSFSDMSIPFDSQAIPFEEYIRNSRHCFGYSVGEGVHDTGEVVAGSMMCRYMRWDESRPGFSNVPPIPGCHHNDPNLERPESRTYMTYVEWGATEHPVLNGRRIRETDSSWSIPIVSVSECTNRDTVFHVDITPRNLQQLDVCEGDTFSYCVTDTGGTVEASGTVVADSLHLLLIPAVPIRLTGAIASVVLASLGPRLSCGDPAAGKIEFAPEGTFRGPALSARLSSAGTSVDILWRSAVGRGEPREAMIADAFGRTVARPSLAPTRGGAFARWHCTGGDGRRVSPGCYFILVCADRTHVQRIVLTK